MTWMPPDRVLRRAARDAIRSLRLSARAGRLMREAEGLSSFEAAFDLLWRFEDFRPLQVRSEIVGLVARVAALRPVRVCEIGPFLGGTSFLFARAAAPDATIVLLDLQMPWTRRRALRRFARLQQRVECLQGDSRDPAVRHRVASCFGGAPVDFLFIDGDHRYDGVAADWNNYVSLVRPGGLVAFHDIVPDHRARFGKDTPSDSGGVPQLWAELKGRFGPAAGELVADPDQDGCGIGMISVGATAPPPGA
ncbi:MAG: class I SAM-dependent methyltransferase [Gemmatimonadales bacterium]|jgi:predicted O-methyltransferase YrrM